MKESRTVKYGRNLAILLNYIIQTIPEPQREGYKAMLVEELNRYPLEPRRRGQARNQGCTYELEGIVDCDIENPEHLARLVKEGIHLMYQKQTAARVLNSLLENL